MKETLPIVLLLLVAIVVFIKNSRNGGNDILGDIPKHYNFFHEQEGVTIYSSWIVNQGTASALVFKLINNNKYPVVINWKGPRWYAKEETRNGFKEVTPADVNADYSLPYDIIKENKDPERIDYSTEVLQSAPNYLYYRAPEGQWQPGDLTVRFDKLLVVPQARQSR